MSTESHTSLTWPHDLGFGPPVDVRGRSSIADMFGRSKRRTGIYLLGYADGTYYIGQARDVVRRFGGHRRQCPDIALFAFFQTRRSELDEVEQATIYRAETLGVSLRNRVHVADVLGPVDLDELVPEESQNRWLDRPAQAIRDGAAPVVLPPDSPQRWRTDPQFRKLAADPRYPTIRRIFASFALNGLLAPGTTQLTYWSVTALPNTNQSHYPRLGCLNVNWMEVLVCGWIPKRPHSFWGFVNVAKSALSDSFRTKRELRTTFPGLIQTEAHYRTAGGNAVHLEMRNLVGFERLMNDVRIQAAVRVLTLQLMRKGPTVFGKVHCPAFADDILSIPATNGWCPGSN